MNQKIWKLIPTPLVIGLISGSIWAGLALSNSRLFLKRTQLIGSFEFNEDYSSNITAADPLYGKWFFLTQNGKRIAARDNFLEIVKDSKGTVLSRVGPAKPYGMKVGEEARVTGVLYEIEELKALLEQRGTLNGLRYPESAEALFDLESIEWLQE